MSHNLKFVTFAIVMPIVVCAVGFTAYQAGRRHPMTTQCVSLPTSYSQTNPAASWPIQVNATLVETEGSDDLQHWHTVWSERAAYEFYRTKGTE